MHKTNQADTSPVPWWHWHRRLYNWVLSLATRPHGPVALLLISIAESSFFPVPPDVLLAPLTLGAPRRWLWFATICSAGSVLGGAAGYMIGMLAWQAIGEWVISHMGWAGLTNENFARFSSLYQRYDFWVVFTCGFTPLPYKVCTISAGIARIHLVGFFVASALSRSARFFFVAGLISWKGQATRDFIERYFNILSLVFVGLLILGFLVLTLIRN